VEKELRSVRLFANAPFLTTIGIHRSCRTLWSLCVEIHFYAAIALTVVLFRRRAIWAVWPACLLITAIRIDAGATINIKTRLRVDKILAGACVATIYNQWTGRTWSPQLFLGAAALWIACSTAHFAVPQYFHPYATRLLLSGALLLGPRLLRSALSSAPMRYIATISYGLYIWHPVTRAGWLGEGGGWQRYLVKRPISFTLAFAAAHASTFYWEKPWTRWARSRFRRAEQSESSDAARSPT
jgi:peptidoglycan/LPS O-acetylase OafA/YrhL